MTGPVKLERRINEFVDVSLSFEPSPLNGDITVLKDERAITNSLKNIVFTRPSEVPFRSDIGSYVKDYLFDFVDHGTAGSLMLEIERSIRNYEPRVELDKVIVEPRETSYDFMVSILYKIKGYDELLTTSFILESTK